MRNFYRMLFSGVAVLAVLGGTCSAATITINAYSRGSYTGVGVFGTGGSGTPTGNYLTGEATEVGITNEYRSFFLFDLAGVTDPIVSATFEVSAGLQLHTSNETLSLFDISTALASIAAGTGGTAGFADLGSGVTYASRVFTGAEALSVPVTTIALNSAAVSALQAGGLFGFGGAITTISGTANQALFAGTDGGYITRLVLQTQDASTPVPEPTSLVLLGTALLGAAVQRYRARG